MNLTTKNFLFVLLLLLTGAFVSTVAYDVAGLFNPVIEDNKVVVCEAPIINLSCPNTCTIETLTNMFSKAHNYTEDEYDCTNYSLDYKETMNNLGFPVKLKAGMTNTSSDVIGHAWNSIDIDSTNFIFLN